MISQVHDGYESPLTALIIYIEEVSTVLGIERCCCLMRGALFGEIGGGEKTKKVDFA